MSHMMFQTFECKVLQVSRLCATHEPSILAGLACQKTQAKTDHTSTAQYLMPCCGRRNELQKHKTTIRAHKTLYTRIVGVSQRNSTCNGFSQFTNRLWWPPVDLGGSDALLDDVSRRTPARAARANNCMVHGATTHGECDVSTVYTDTKLFGAISRNCFQ